MGVVYRDGKGGLSLHNTRHLMRHVASDRSTEEIIALFISITFLLDAVKGMVKSECRAVGYLL